MSERARTVGVASGDLYVRNGFTYNVSDPRVSRLLRTEQRLNRMRSEEIPNESCHRR